MQLLSNAHKVEGLISKGYWHGRLFVLLRPSGTLNSGAQSSPIRRPASQHRIVSETLSLDAWNHLDSVRMAVETEAVYLLDEGRGTHIMLQAELTPPEVDLPSVAAHSSRRQVLMAHYLLMLVNSREALMTHATWDVAVRCT